MRTQTKWNYLFILTLTDPPIPPYDSHHTGDTRDDCLNKILAKNAFVEIPNSSNQPQQICGNGDKSTITPVLSFTKDIVPTHWWDGTLIEHSEKEISSRIAQPPLHTGWEWPRQRSNATLNENQNNFYCPYYRTIHKKISKKFTEHHGKMYRPLFHEMEKRLTLLSNSNSTFTIPLDHPFHHILPSFFHTLENLQKRGKRYNLVFRSFGSDLQNVAIALSDFAVGRHPLFPNFREPSLILSKEFLFRGRYKKVASKTITEQNDVEIAAIYELHQWDSDLSIPIASGDIEVLKIIENVPVCGIQDDYHFWKENNFMPSSGKPVWFYPPSDAKKYKNNTINIRDEYCHHILFDDNIHNDPTNSIVSIRSSDSLIKNKAKFRPLNGDEIINQHGKHIIRVPTIEPIMNPNWFLEQITAAEKCLTNKLH